MFNLPKKMTKTVFCLFCFFSFLQSIAQISFSSAHQEWCIWLEESSEFGNCSRWEESSLFVMNKDETMFTHTIESKKSTYYVISREHNIENDVWTYDVKSDVGNKYLYVFDLNNNVIKAVSVIDDKTILAVYFIKAIF